MKLATYLALAIVLTLSASRSADAVLVTLNPTRDTLITPGSGNADHNWGGHASLGVGSHGDERHNTLIGFDLSGLPGAGMMVTSATLRLFYQSTSTASRSVDVYEVTAANGNWLEGTATNTASTDDGATWNNRDGDGGGGWTGAVGLEAPGTAYHSELLSNVTVPGIIADETPVDFALGSGQYSDLTAMVESWSASMPGLLLRLPDSATVTGSLRTLFSSRQESDADLRPQLILNIEEVPVPEPSTSLLLGLGALGLLRYTRRRRKLA